MIKKIVKFLSVISLIIILAILYLSIFGIKTSKFNNQIKNKILENNKGINLDLKKIKITLSPLDFKANIIILDTKILFNKNELELESLKTKISLLQLFKNQFLIDNLQISSKSIKVRNLVSFIRYFKNDPKLLFLEMMIKDGYLEGNLNLNFDKKGKIKNDYKIKGFVKNLKIKTFNKYNFENLTFIFDIKDKKYKFLELDAQFNKVRLNSPIIEVEEKDNSYLINGKILSIENDIPINLIKDLLNLFSVDLSLNSINLASESEFFFKVNKKFKFSNLNINSEISLNKLTFKNKSQSIQKYFPKVKELIDLKDHKIKFNYNKDTIKIIGEGKIIIEDNEDKINYEITQKNTDKSFNIKDFNINSEISLSKLTYKNNFLSFKKYFPEVEDVINLKDHKINFNYNKDSAKISGLGKILIKNNEDKISYEIVKINEKYFFKKILQIKNNIILINELKYKKNKNKDASIKIEGTLDVNKNIFFKKVSLIENDNSILIKNLNLNSKFKISNIGLLEFDYKNHNKIYNKLYLKKNKKDYILEGKSFDASKLINDVMKSEDGDSSIFSNLNSKIKIKVKRTYIDDVNFINNLFGSIQFKDNKLNYLKLEANFPNEKKIDLSIQTTDELGTTTKLISSYPKPLIKRYKFIKGFEEGLLKFSSIKKNGVSNSLLIIDNFKIKEAPIFAKLLSLASFKGIADLLTGEGIRFTNFEMNFSSQKNLTTIEEMYAIGPAVSILMDGYIDSEKLISLRGTLVPATTVNHFISSIPFLGKILIGERTGEGVFGVSFKIKGPPKNLKTTVNPIKSLTPRFITRTLEQIKKN
jgi:hypothetical protein